ncbi:MAG: carbohydrate ABC transporter permease, partial [Clostridia bacterium]
MKKLFLHLVMILFVLAMAFPFLWMISSAFKTKAEVFRFPPSLIPDQLLWSNFAEAYQGAPFGRYIFNSLFTAVGIVVIQIVNSALMAYALTQLQFRGRGFLFAVIMGTNMLPAAATYVPGYIILAKMGLLNTYTGLIVSNCVYMFGIFLIRQAFLQVHKSLVEAAWMEGSTH